MQTMFDKNSLEKETMMRILVLTILSGLSTAQECTLCVDGSLPDFSRTSERLSRSCSELLDEARGLVPGTNDCLGTQVIGFQDCGCPTYPDGFCFLCPDGSADIPDITKDVPSTPNLTCGDILFLPEGALTSCDQLYPFQEMCGCPVPSGEPCNFCANGETPTFQERVIPYLSSDGVPVTCGSHARDAERAAEPSCSRFEQAPVPVDGQAFCGCPGTTPYDLCTMCPEGAIVNPDLIVPNTGGLTCRDLQDYVRFVTDANSCAAIAASADVCCQELPSCPICPDGSNSIDPNVVYPPYDLTCEYLGNANIFGFPMTCSDVQERFPYFCGCLGVLPACTICGNGEQPQFTERAIPLFDETCEEMNAFASIRRAEECQEVTDLPVNVAAYCGCRDAFPPNTCELCPVGSTLVDDLNYFPPGAGDANCRDLSDFARYVTNSLMCSEVQQFAPDCCSGSAGNRTTPTLAPVSSSATYHPGHLSLLALPGAIAFFAIVANV